MLLMTPKSITKIYLAKNPNGYCHVDLNLVDQPLEKEEFELKIKSGENTQTMQNLINEININPEDYSVPSDEELRAKAQPT
ncbi:bifunctional peptide-methionine (S)-S-oxide reductase MsrA/peptide-methionine (R)-S-oxide reductase MsrB [Oligella ureolytica]